MRRKIICKVLLIIMILVIFQLTLSAQIGVSPSVLFIDPNTKTGNFELKNNGDVSKEVDIQYRFGYSTMDSNYTPKIEYKDTANEKKYSLIPYITSFPKKLTLDGKQPQVMRFLVKGFNNLPDGAYWTRAAVRARDIAKQIDTTNTGGKVTANFQIVTETINVIVFYKGNVTTGLKIDSLKQLTDTSSNKNLIFFCKREGNCPFWGFGKLAIYDKEENLIQELESRVTVYFDNPVKYVLDNKLYKPGKYKAVLKVDNVRDDIPENFRLKVKPIIKEFEFEII